MDSILPQQECAVRMVQADTFVLMVGVRTNGGHTLWEPWPFTVLEEAVDLIGEIERGEHRGQVGELSAYKDGKYVRSITTGTMVAERRQDAKDDARHASFGRAGL